MLFKKQIKAGILPYALLMLACFSLLVQFYGQRQSSEYQQVVASRQEAEAYLMAQLALDHLASLPQSDTVTGEQMLSFNKGLVQYKKERNRILLSVQLAEGPTFAYRFPLPSQKK